MFFFMSWRLGEGFVTDDFFAMEKAPFPIEVPRMGSIARDPCTHNDWADSRHVFAVGLSHQPPLDLSLPK